ncbi:MAG: flavodoxin family protein [Nanoarchaeota archaeon]
MRLTLISGSPRKGMNSESILNYMMEEFQNAGHNVETINLSETNISFCNACGNCANVEECINDDNANYVNSLLKKADAIVVITPVYFGSMTAQLKAMIDKTLPLRRNGFLLKGKTGACIAVGKSRNGGQELAIKDIHSWMFIQGMVVVGDNSHFGGAVVSDFKDDETGKDTVDGVIDAVKSQLSN